MNSRKYHKIAVGHDVFEIDVRYSDLKRIGQGSYGSVVSAKDDALKRPVAIKKIKNIFQDATFAKRILREIKLLRHFHSHSNIVTILDIMLLPPSSSPEHFSDVYIVTNLMESDLDQILSSSQHLTSDHEKYFLYQILRGLYYVHSANVVHRDLKPSNILLNANCDLALCDFGLARGLLQSPSSSSSSGGDHKDDDDDDDSGTDDLTEYVVTRWYRAPELLCGANSSSGSGGGHCGESMTTTSSSYGKGVDVWSVGCIFAEILKRGVLFEGRSPVHQLTIILGILGVPESKMSSQGGQGCCWGFESHQVAREVLDAVAAANDGKMSATTGGGLRGALPEGVDDEAYDLLSKMLKLNPDERITVKEALEHPYLRELQGQMDELEHEIPFNSAFEINKRKNKVKNLTIAELRYLMFEESNNLRDSELGRMNKYDEQFSNTDQLADMV